MLLSPSLQLLTSLEARTRKRNTPKQKQVALSRDDTAPASFDSGLQQVRFSLIDGSTRVLVYVSVGSLLDAARRDRREAAFPPPLALFEHYRDRIEKAAVIEFEAGRAQTIKVRGAVPFVWVRTF